MQLLSFEIMRKTTTKAQLAKVAAIFIDRT